MSQTQVITSTSNALSLDVAELKTVKWISSNYFVRRSYNISSAQYRRLKIITALSWMLAPIELVVISFYLFIHKLPWPNWFLQILFKVDRIIENILEGIGRKFEWWLDVLMVELMWFMDSVETFIDSILSLTLFVIHKVVDLWLWSFGVVVKFVHMLLFPYIWVFRQVMPQEKIPSSPVGDTSSNNSWGDDRGVQPEIRVTDTTIREVSHVEEPTSERDNKKETDDDRISNTSECDSDVSAVSESWIMGHTNRPGKYYNRVEMKATAEGRLRAAMYKRVKSKLQVMRKNSINFSRGMTFYARVIIEPKIRPVFTAIEAWLLQLAKTFYARVIIEPKIRPVFTAIEGWLLQLAKKHNLLVYYESFLKWLEANSILARPFNIAILLLKKIVSTLVRRKGKSRRTRSMRSESLRRKTMNVAATNLLTIPIGLNKSAEPVAEEDFCNLQKTALKDGSDSDVCPRDSALASSIDESYHTSDSGEGSISIKDQTIAEEEEDEDDEPTAEDQRKNHEEKAHPDTIKSVKVEPCFNGAANANDTGRNVTQNNGKKQELQGHKIEKRKRRRNLKDINLSSSSETLHEAHYSDVAEKSPTSDSSEIGLSPKQPRKISFTL